MDDLAAEVHLSPSRLSSVFVEAYGKTPLAADEVVRYPRAMAGGDFRPAYPLAQLQLALDKAGSTLRIVPSDYAMEQDRALLQENEQRYGPEARPRDGDETIDAANEALLDMDPET